MNEDPNTPAPTEQPTVPNTPETTSMAEVPPTSQQAEVTPSAQEPQTSTPTPMMPTLGTNDAKKRGGKFLKLGLVPLAVIAALIVFGGGALAYFGYVVPNKPENVWKSALTNTSKAYDSLVTESKQQKELKGASLDGSYKFNTASLSGDGTFKGEFYDKSGTLNATFGTSGMRFTLDALAVPAGDATYPDMYFKVSGLSGLGSLLGGQGLDVSQFDNQWFSVDHTFFDQLSKENPDAAKTQFSKDDIVAIEEAIGQANRDYLFSTDPNKAVLKVAKTIGKETKDGRATIHYEVGYDKEHLKQYMTALHDNLKKTKLGELYKDQYDEMFNLDEMKKSIDKADANSTVDVWVDTKTKLIRVVKLTDTKNKDQTFEIALNYNGKGSELPFVITAKDKEGSLVLKLNVDTKAQSAVVDASFDGTTDGQKASGSLKANFKASDKKVEVKKPDGAKSIMEALGGLYSQSGLLSE